MTIVIPVTGTARCGKTTLMDQLSRNFLADPSYNCVNVVTLDSSQIAKEFLDQFVNVSPRFTFNKSMKSDLYRQALVDIIKAIDSMDIRVSDLQKKIIDFTLDHPTNIGKHNVIFINIREISVIAKLVKELSYISDNYIKCVTLICDRPGQSDFANTTSDSANFTAQAKKANINFISVEIPNIKGLGVIQNIDANEAHVYDDYVINLNHKILENASINDTKPVSKKSSKQ